MKNQSSDIDIDQDRCRFTPVTARTDSRFKNDDPFYIRTMFFESSDTTELSKEIDGYFKDYQIAREDIIKICNHTIIIDRLPINKVMMVYETRYEPEYDE